MPLPLLHAGELLLILQDRSEKNQTSNLHTYDWGAMYTWHGGSLQAAGALEEHRVENQMCALTLAPPFSHYVGLGGA